MKISQTPQVKEQLELLSQVNTNKTGFIIGHQMGLFRIISNLWPINFNQENLNQIYTKVYKVIDDKILGVFFNFREPFYSDWFIENIIIKISVNQTQFFFYDINRNLVPL